MTKGEPMEQRIYFIHGPQGSGKTVRAHAILGVRPGDHVGTLFLSGGVAMLDYGRKGVLFEGDPGPEAAKAASVEHPVVVVCSCDPPSYVWRRVEEARRRVYIEDMLGGSVSALAIRPEVVARLRETGAPVRHVVRALREAGGDEQAARDLLRQNSYFAMGPVTEGEAWFLARGAWP